MRDRPILFSAPMVRALLDGSKTQTRRALRNQPGNVPGQHAPIASYRTPAGRWNFVLAATGHGTGDPFECPYGVRGDQLWVREAWSGEHCYQDEPPSQRVSVMTPDGPMFRDLIWYWADGQPDYGDWERPRPSIHMPRYASRITLEVTTVRVERLQDISEADAQAEGCTFECMTPTGDDIGSAICGPGGYLALWESINGAGSWATNPWVWVVEFRVLPRDGVAALLPKGGA